MSIKLEITQMLKDGKGDVKISDIASLHHWTKTALDEPCDKLEVKFKAMAGVKGGMRYSIKSRDYDGILKEVMDRTKEYFMECAYQSNKNLQNGYR